LIDELLGPSLWVGIELWDGTHVGPPNPAATIKIRSVDALVRIVQRPNQLGLARAYASGDLSVEGDIFAVLVLPEQAGPITPSISQVARLAWACGLRSLRPLPIPPEEAHVGGLLHSRSRDRQAIAHHYDISNDFYRLVLGPSMTYSCALWTSPEVGLDRAQFDKHELVCRKLGLVPGQRLLDVGCGWGTLATHAANHYQVAALGITLSQQQYWWASRATNGTDSQNAKRASRGPGRADFRVLDYRDLDEQRFDAISSVGMSEHVGHSNLLKYFQQLHRSLKPGGRLLNHAISALPAAVANGTSRWPSLIPLPSKRTGFRRNSFIGRYIFPDGELVEVGAVISAMQQAGFEVRHVEGLREHYDLTLRAWVDNLEQHWDRAVDLVGLRRAHIWRLYMAGAAKTFAIGNTGVHQVLAVKPAHGRSGLPLRPAFEPQSQVSHQQGESTYQAGLRAH
jgi:cyclopropane-fatty-acyl-phospholipid synthase